MAIPSTLHALLTVRRDGARSAMIPNGLMKALALELSREMIRVIAPTTVGTGMVNSEKAFRAFQPNLKNQTEEDVKPGPSRSTPRIP